MKVMVAEDGSPVRQMLCEVLENLGVQEIVECTNGLEAIQYIENNQDERLSAIFLDLNMEGMNGLSFLQKYKRKSTYNDIPIFVITGDPSQEKMKTCFRHEIYCYVEKPFSLKQIQECLSIAQKIEAADNILEKAITC